MPVADQARRAETPRPILLYVRSVDGGISEYMHEQGNELARRGYRVVMLAPAGFLARHPERAYDGRALIAAASSTIRPLIVRRLLYALCAVVNPYILASEVALLRPQFVLLDSMSELLAPLWAWPHRLLAGLGVTRYVATMHDPRPPSSRLGWWDRLSLRAAYAPLSIGLVHDLDAAVEAEVPAHVRLVEVPHGIFPIATTGDAADVRASLAIPPQAPLALSFGFVADRKNLGLAIEALARVPALHLVVAGRRGSSRDRPVEFYREQARRLGVQDRCHFIERYLDDAELAGLFRAADFLLLAYTGSFASQSGVLHTAAHWSLSVLVSGGAGPMLKTVQRYGLGEIVPPDSTEALVQGFQRMISADRDVVATRNGWERFRGDASWARNVDLLLAAVRELDRPA